MDSSNRVPIEPNSTLQGTAAGLDGDWLPACRTAGIVAVAMSVFTVSALLACAAVAMVARAVGIQAP